MPVRSVEGSRKLTTTLVVVDMQKYYLDPGSTFCRHCGGPDPAALRYIHQRSRDVVIPNIQRLLAFCRRRGVPVIYLRLCGVEQDRRDLHRFFRDVDREAVARGLGHAYPTQDEPLADVADEIRPAPGDLVLNKTTFSAFSSTHIEALLRERGIETLLMTGLATSQCVETTARDASDRGFDIVHIEDAQADYDETTHRASLFSSRGVCGGLVVSTDGIIG